jgi:hypothetical protein
MIWRKCLCDEVSILLETSHFVLEFFNLLSSVCGKKEGCQIANLSTCLTTLYAPVCCSCRLLNQLIDFHEIWYKWLTAVGNRRADHTAPSIRKGLLTSGGRSVGIVRLRTEATEFKYCHLLLYCHIIISVLLYYYYYVLLYCYIINSVLLYCYIINSVLLY